MPPKEAFAEALRFLGCVVSGEHPVMDGQKHRISVEGEKFSEKAGANFYVGFLDGHRAGDIKNNKSGIDMKWKSKGYVLDSRQKEQLQAEAAATQQARQARQARAQEQAAQRVARQMTDLVPVLQPTPYMLAKGIEPQPGVFTGKDGRTTCVPAMDANGKQGTMQYIQEDGTKRFARDSRKEGCCHVIGDMDALAQASALVIGSSAWPITDACPGWTRWMWYDSTSCCRMRHRQLPPESHQLLIRMHGEHAITELMDWAQRSSRTKFRDQVLTPLLKQELVEMTFPEKPNSSKQRYRLTASGLNLLAGRNVNKKLGNDQACQFSYLAVKVAVTKAFATEQDILSVYIPLSADSRDILAYVNQPLEARKPVGYQRDFLDAYVPNQSGYLSESLRRQLRKMGETGQAEAPAGAYSRAMLNRLLIDLSWASSHLEGNTYARLDTRELIEHGKVAQGKAAIETQMILNHKSAIELLVENAGEVGFGHDTLMNLHSALAENLLPNPSDEGRICQHAVKIGKSVYRPLAAPQHINEALDLLLKKANQIVDPFEQSFFVMVHLPYLQPFADRHHCRKFKLSPPGSERLRWFYGP